MVVNESERFELHQELRNRLGENVAEVLMEHLPPSGWSDVARTSDIGHLRADMNTRFSRIEKSIDGVVRGVWAALGIFSAAFIALFSLIAAKG